MPINLKALIVVLTIAAAIFALAKPICVRYMEPSAFNRRRLVWFALTIAAFVSPTIWLYALIAMPVMFVAAMNDDNPCALFTMVMFAAPNSNVPLPTVVIAQLFDVTHTRLLMLTMLMPLLFRRVLSGRRGLTGTDWCLVAYGVLQMALLVPYESYTNTIRRGFLFSLDTLVVFYAFARVPPTREAIGEVMASFAVMCAVLAPIAVFESLRGWLLYTGISEAWGSPNVFAFLMRGDSLRALASTEHSILLGHVFTLGIGMWIYLQSLEANALKNRAIFGLLCCGLFFTYSRGPWVSAVLLLAICMAFRPGAASYLVKLLPTLAVIGVLVYVSPLKESLIDRLPLIGTADQGTIDYRARLAEVSWQLIQLHPMLGDPFVLRNMEELRQGQGIIDIVNAYVGVALFSGGVGLVFFVALFLHALWRGIVAIRYWRAIDTGMTMLGVVLLACMLSSLFYIGTAGVGPLEYVVAGLLVAYAKVAMPRTAPAPVLHPIRGQGYMA